MINADGYNFYRLKLRNPAERKKGDRVKTRQREGISHSSARGGLRPLNFQSN